MILYGSDTLFDVVEINLLNYCNRNCSFCPSNPFVDKKKYLEMLLYKKMLNDISDIDEKFSGVLCFSGFSEPLLHPNIMDIIRLTKEILPKCSVELNTNGDFVTEEMIRNLFNNGLDILYISIYSKKDSERINKLNKYNYNVQMRKRYGDNDTLWTNVAGTLTGYKELKIERACYYPFYLLYLNYNGNIGFCCNDYAERYTLGNIKNNSVNDLWYSDKLNELRNMLIKNKRTKVPCSTCNVNGTIKGEEKYNTWVNILKK